MRRFPKTAILRWLILLWSLMGIAAWAMQISASPEDLAKGDPATAQIWAMMPLWAWGGYAVAVWAGLAGALALLAGRRLATLFFALSTLGIIVQFGWSFLGSPLLALKGWSTAIFPAILFAIALAETLYARALSAKGRLT
jgi:hypothetical protein